jgi:signal transduction histidine kinase
MDAMPHGGNLWVSTRMMPDGDQIELVVRDDGVGIPPEILPHIFDPFTTTKEVGKGVGLGLAVSKGIVERHGGHIEAASELGVGTSFHIILPMRAVHLENTQAQASLRN